MSKKSKFLKSAKLAIAGVVLAGGLSSCSLLSEKHACKSDEAKAEKSACSSKHSCSANKGKASCSSKHSCAAN